MPCFSVWVFRRLVSFRCGSILIWTCRLTTRIRASGAFGAHAAFPAPSFDYVYEYYVSGFQYPHLEFWLVLWPNEESLMSHYGIPFDAAILDLGWHAAPLQSSFTQSPFTESFKSIILLVISECRTSPGVFETFSAPQRRSPPFSLVRSTHR
jgi:hypothetical protein